MTGPASSRYDDEPVSIEFTHREWSLLLSCADKRRRDTHDRADRLERDDAERHGSQIAGLRRKATALFVLTETIQARMADVRCDSARNVDAAAS